MKKEKSLTYQTSMENIRKRLDSREYSIGLDLGVGSIGIAVVAMEPDENGTLYANDIIYASSRIFTSSKGASDRRKYRGQRNSIRHKAHRLRKLWQLLATKGLMKPYSSETVENPATLRFSTEMLRRDPYKLRLKGLKNKLSLEEIGVALYHIANHRGSSSVRSFLNEEKTKEEEMAEEQMSKTQNLAKRYNVDTYIEVLDYFNMDEIKGYRNKDTRSSSFIMPIPTRDIILSEFENLINTQKQFYSDILDDNFISGLREIIFYENPKIVPEAGNCPYFPDEKKLPKAAFINEERRLWEALNNIRVLIDRQTANGLIYTEKMPLEKDEKEKLFIVLREGNNVTPSFISKAFPKYGKLKKDNILLQGSDKKNTEIKGFRFKKLEQLPYFSILKDDDKDKYISLFVNTPDDISLKNKLISQLGFSTKTAESAILDTPKLVGDYAPVGKTAMTLLMPFIKDGLSFQEAEQEAIQEGIIESQIEKKVYDYLPYYGEVVPSSTQSLAGKAWHSSFSSKIGKKGFIKPDTNKDEEKYGRIANPVVHQTLNELRKLVNEVIKIMGKKPHEITVELGRELKLGKEAREKLIQDNNNRAKDNEKIYTKYCVPNNLPTKYIKRFRLLEDQDYKCPYCLGSINCNDVISGNADIDHIFPKEDTADSSENNLVLAHKICNENRKKKQIPQKAFGSDTVLWNRIEQYLDNTPKMANKRWRFEMTDDKYQQYLAKNTFLNRFKSDNAFVARIACEYLLSLFPPENKFIAVRTIKGAETAALRKAWNLNGITNSLASLHSGEDNDTLDSKNRTDARHHALDAIIAAYYTYSAKQMIGSISQNNCNQDEIAQRVPIPKFFRRNKTLSTSEQRKDFRKTIENFIINNTFVSRKVDINRNGELLAATQYSILAIKDENLILYTKKRLKNINASTFFGNKSGSVEYALNGKFSKPKWINMEQEKQIDKLLEHNQQLFESIISNKDKAEEELQKENYNRISIGKKTISIDEKKIVTMALKLTGGIYYTLTNNQRKKVFIAKEPTLTEKGFAFDTGENFSLDLFHDENGKINGEIIRKINAVNAKYVPQYKKKGFSLFERIYPGDILEVDLIPRSPTGAPKDFVKGIKSPNAPLDKTFLVVKTFTEAGKSIQVYYDSLMSSKPEQKGSFYISVLNKQNIRKVCLTEAGLLIYRSRLLKDRENVESS